MLPPRAIARTAGATDAGALSAKRRSPRLARQPSPGSRGRPSPRALRSAGSCRDPPAARSMAANRRSNLLFVARSTASGSTSRCRARLTAANRRSPTSAAAVARSAMASSRSISSASSRILARTASGSFQSKPTLPALACSLSARVRAGRATGTPARAVSSPLVFPAFSARSALLMRSHRPSTPLGVRSRASPNT